MAEQNKFKRKLFCFVLANLKGKFILCYFAYAYVASEDQAYGSACFTIFLPYKRMNSQGPEVSSLSIVHNN